MDKKMINIENSDGSITQAELITYLMSDDQQKNYVVFSKGEMSGNEGDEIIYISKLARNGDALYLEEILDDTEWSEVQMLLKRIANASA